MTDAAVSISPANIETLEQFYTFRERTEVLEFLDKHPFLVPVLLEAPEKIRHYSPDSQLFLEVFIDPDSIDWVQLILSIFRTYALRSPNPLKKGALVPPF